ncbi:Zinc finger, CCHC-type [Sesbania bispinosa]|nr:Zinc finger, CCHC-type [Sesbania bispinosa]
MSDNKDLSPEEADLLARSTKKAKVGGLPESQDEGDTVVLETCPEALERSSSSSPSPLENSEVKDGELGSKREVLSYKDICLGLANDHSEVESSNSEESDDSDYEEAEDDEDSSDDNEDSSSREDQDMDDVDVGVVSCPIIKAVEPHGRNGGGPWMILGHYLVVQKWRPKFFPLENELSRVVVWIRIPSLPIEYYDRTILGKIGDTIGRTVRIDSNTMKPKNGVWDETVTERGKFARLCIEVDLRRSLVSQFELLGRTYSVEYEGLYLICFSCGKYGHRADGCPLKNNVEPTVQGAGENVNSAIKEQQKMAEDVRGKGNGTYGPWMLVQKGMRKRQGTTAQNSKKDNNEMIGDIGKVADKNISAGSRFAALADDPMIVEEPGQGAGESTINAMGVQPSDSPNGPAPQQKTRVAKNVEAPSLGHGKATLPLSQSGPTSFSKIKKAAREQASMALDLVEAHNVKHIHNKPPLTLSIPVAQPFIVQQATICSPTTNMGIEICNSRPPDPLNKPSPLVSLPKVDSEHHTPKVVGAVLSDIVCPAIPEQVNCSNGQSKN